MKRTLLVLPMLLVACSEPVVTPGPVGDAGVDLTIVLPYLDPEVVEPQTLAAQPGVLDVHFSVDTTGSFGDEIVALRESLSTRLVPELQRRVADVAYGVSGFEDFPIAPYGDSNDEPFTLLTPITDDIELAQGAVEALELGSGSDVPESGYEALYQIATGDGFGEFIEPYDGPGEGGVGFRPGSVRVVVHITDAESHTPASYGTDVPGTHDEADVVAAMQALGIVVVGVASGEAAVPQLRSLALETDAITAPVDGACPTGAGGSTVPPVDGTCPLVFDIAANGEGLSDAVEDGIVGLLDTLVFAEVYGEVRDDDNGFVQGIDATNFTALPGMEPTVEDLRPADGIDDTFANVSRGTEVGFDIRFRNTTVEPTNFVQSFILTVEIRGDDSVLRRLVVQVVVPGLRGLPDGVTGGGTFSDGACAAGGPATALPLALLLLVSMRRRR